MSTWRIKRLEEVGHILTGTTPSRNHPEDWGHAIPFITPSDFGGYGKYASNSERMLSKIGIARHAKRILPQKCILVTCIGSDMGKVVMNTTPCLTNQQINAILPSENTNPDHLYYALCNAHETLRTYGSDGTAVPILNKGDFGRLEFLFPPLTEQRAIASVLCSLDDKIDLLRRQNRTLEALAETLFRQWFVEEASDDWEEGTLGEVIEIFDGKRIPLSKMERDQRKDGQLYPYYGAAKIMDYVNDYIFDGEYILLGEDGTVRTDEGLPVLQFATGKFWVNNHAHVLKAKPPYSNFFLWKYLSRTNIDQIVTGAVQPKINQGNLRALSFPRFPVEIVQTFSSITEPLRGRISQNEQSIMNLEALRDTLLPKLMSGEVRVQYE